MSLTPARLVEKLRKDFEKRADMVLFAMPDDPDQPAIVGMVRKVYNVSRTTESTFQTFNRTADEPHFVGFCVEIRWGIDGLLTKKAEKWREWWVGLGGIHAIGRSEWDVYNELGMKPE